MRAAVIPRTASTARRASSMSRRDDVVDLGGDRADLDGAVGRGGAAGGPVERGVEGRELEDHEAAELLLGLGIRPVLDVAPAVLDADDGSGGGPAERLAADIDASLDEHPVVGAPGADVGVALVERAIREPLRGLVDQQG